MNNLKKFFAFSIATAMVAGAVWAITPALKLSAYNESSTFNYDQVSGKYVEADNGQVGQYTYDQVITSGKEIAGEYKGNPVGPSGDSGSLSTAYTVTYNLTNVTSFPEVKSVPEKASYRTELSVAEGYAIDVINVYMNEENITSTAYNSQTGVVYINSVTGNIMISASARKVVKELIFEGVDEDGLKLTVGKTTELKVVGIDKYPSDKYEYQFVLISDENESISNKILHIDGFNITPEIEVSGRLQLGIFDKNDLNYPVAVASCKIEVVEASSTPAAPASSTPTNADPRGITSHDDVVVTPAVVANYQKWLTTFGGGTAEGTQAVSGTAGQPGSEVVVADPKTGQTLHMFQSTDNSNTLLAAPESIVPSGTKITTLEAAADTPAFKAVQNKIARVSRRGSVQKVYGIAATAADGTLITTLNGKAAMSVPIPADINVPAGRTLVVYFIPNEGETTKLETVIDQGRVVFGTPGFGTFAFVVE